jgi:hypothetical protein
VAGPDVTTAVDQEVRTGEHRESEDASVRSIDVVTAAYDGFATGGPSKSCPGCSIALAPSVRRFGASHGRIVSFQE